MSDINLVSAREKRAFTIFQATYNELPRSGLDFCSIDASNCGCGLPTKKQLISRVLAGAPIWKNEEREMIE